MADSNPLPEFVNNLQGLSSALPNFTLRWNELQNHLDFIQKRIEARSKQLERRNENAEVLDSRSELGVLCQAMNAKGLRKFIIANLSDIEKIEEDAQLALKSAPDPAKLVFEFIGGFYIQGNKAYEKKETHLLSVRQACIHVLEFFLSSGANVNDSVRGDAEKAANLWRNRIVNEGGVAKATKLDALGLLLFVLSFGIPSQFTPDDLYELIRLTGLRETAGVRKKSQFLIEKIADIIQRLVENKIHVVAVAIAFAFGLEEKFHPVSLLREFLCESKETTKGMRRGGQGSGAAQREADVKRLADLKLVLKCSEDHNLDSELAGEKVKDEVAALEKQINMVKRNADELGGVQGKRKAREGKRPRHIPSGASVGNGIGPSIGIGGGRVGSLAGIGDPQLVGNGVVPYGLHGEGAFSKIMVGPLSSAHTQSMVRPPPAAGPNFLGAGPPPSVQSLVGQSTSLLGTGHSFLDRSTLLGSGHPNLYQFGNSTLGIDSSHGASQFGSSALPAYASYLH